MYQKSIMLPPNLPGHASYALMINHESLKVTSQTPPCLPKNADPSERVLYPMRCYAMQRANNNPKTPVPENKK